MIDELGSIIDAFPGAANQTRCFLHIINLVAKSILRQFEPPKARNKDLLSEGAKELAALARDLGSVDEHNGEDNDADGLEDDDEDGKKDEHEGMNDEEIAELEECVQPVRLVLAKASHFKLSFSLFTHTRSWLQLRKIAFTMKNSTTIILPVWYSTVEELGLNARMMPRDVSTRWNSTFDMVNFAIDYQTAIDAITGNHDMKMRNLELDAPEWEIAKELRDTLKVCI